MIYARIREKVIGKTFSYVCSLEDIYDDLVGNGIFPEAERILHDNKNALVALLDGFCNEGRCNFRALKHSFRDFDCFIKRLDKCYLKSQQFCHDLACIFIGLDYARQTGELQYEQFERPTLSGLSEDGNTPVFKQVMCRMGFDGSCLGNAHNELIFADGLWREIIWDKPVRDDTINDTIKYSRYFLTKIEPDWLRLWRWAELEDKEATEIVEKVLGELKAFAYTKPGEIRHIFTCLVGLVAKGALKRTVNELMSMLADYMKELIERNQLDYPNEEDNFSMADDAWGGYMFWRLDDTEASKGISEEINMRLKSIDRERRRDEFIASFSNMQDDLSQFINLLKTAPFRECSCFVFFEWPPIF